MRTVAPLALLLALLLVIVGAAIVGPCSPLLAPETRKPDPELEHLNERLCREVDQVFERHGHRRTPECLAEVEALRQRYAEERRRLLESRRR